MGVGKENQAVSKGSMDRRTVSLPEAVIAPVMEKDTGTLEMDWVPSFRTTTVTLVWAFPWQAGVLPGAGEITAWASASKETGQFKVELFLLKANPRSEMAPLGPMAVMANQVFAVEIPVLLTTNPVVLDVPMESMYLAPNS